MENCVTIVTTDVSYIASYLGKLIGTFYDEEGNPTKDLKRVTKRRIQAEKLVQQQKKDEEKFPNCNSRWSEANGGEVYFCIIFTCQLFGLHEMLLFNCMESFGYLQSSLLTV